MVWGWFWDDFGMVLGWFWDHFGMVLGRFWDGFGMVWGWFWDDFGMVLVPILGTLFVKVGSPPPPSPLNRELLTVSLGTATYSAVFSPSCLILASSLRVVM